ncbi:MAG TPA: biopolymer transporter ExbD [Nitrosomonas nitrosa]|jgi:biopolymer transport protein ExbD|uniref:Biopolymer transport protein exbD1 n=1 Tax=Nitrosomonas nitrosa TaxID=52442 RepID=A0A1I4SFV3_9PROT|nr:biopolymer transporter ExbD [Nitrosomonas nitrosa]MCO6434347.1 biopolymer transporter ExbD [Nitrosomonas nitrosa]PTQ93716.1 outer membrane transport energization protein ExbD [Nitrosomonas nitrosa]CAE6518611.1 Biopolymer transport protein exbD1 [Nitrosomonas nitrosa]SFM63254.1 outer membrane transport energization protein ExbD [Nitrosomonas nitrosa]HBZ29126.1 biopolymer transporter ExbD [Nitrosomonas nitrosa]
MAFGSSDRYQGQTTMSEINVVPLVDVMLVLLIIFIITAPLLTHSVKIDLPKASSNPNTTQPEHIEFAIRDDGSYFWNGETITLEQLAPRFTQSAENDPKIELHIRADKLTHYEHVARIMSLAAKSGITKIGFITDPTQE